MCWSFATINGRIGEIYFNKDKNGRIRFEGHSYVKRSDFTIPAELRALEKDIKKYKVIYRNKRYKFVKLTRQAKSA